MRYRHERGVVIIGAAFAAALAVAVGSRMSADAMSVVIGVACGVLASVPPAWCCCGHWRVRRPGGRTVSAERHGQLFPAGGGRQSGLRLWMRPMVRRTRFRPAAIPAASRRPCLPGRAASRSSATRKRCGTSCATIFPDWRKSGPKRPKVTWRPGTSPNLSPGGSELMGRLGLDNQEVFLCTKDCCGLMPTPSRALNEKVAQAADRYRHKFGGSPTVLYQSDDAARSEPAEFNGVRLVPSRHVLKHHFWIASKRLLSCPGRCIDES